MRTARRGGRARCPGSDAVDQIDQRLHQQLPADAGSRLVKRLRRHGQLAVPEQPDQPIAQIPAFEQHEDDHRQHEPGRAQRTDDRTEPREARETGHRRRGDHDGPRPGSFARVRFAKVGPDVFDRLLQLLDRSPLARAAHVRDLRQDVGAVARKVLGQMVHLPRQTPAGETEDREHQRDHREHGWDAADPSLKPGDRGSQHEREKDGEGDRDEHGLRPVQDDHDEHTPGERHPRFQCSRHVIH